MVARLLRVIRSVMSSPLNPGRCRSQSTTSGFSLRTCGSASSPLSASPTTSMSTSPARIIFRPVRTSAWSSIRNTLIVILVPLSPTPAARLAPLGCRGKRTGAVQRATDSRRTPAFGPRPFSTVVSMGIERQQLSLYVNLRSTARRHPIDESGEPEERLGGSMSEQARKAWKARKIRAAVRASSTSRLPGQPGMAERVGFEPTEGLTLRRFSSA